MQSRTATFRSSGAAQRGFTAIEIAMVATVIAIFALLVLPIFRNRVEQAKIAAANADLISLYKALTLEQADTGFYVRLEDLDNAGWDTSKDPPTVGVTVEVPIFKYGTNGDIRGNHSMALAEWRLFAGPVLTPKWKGPYIAFQNAVSYYDVLNDTSSRYNPMLRSKNGTDYNYRPIQDVPKTGSVVPGDPADPGHNLFDSSDQFRPNRIPVDPWGNPYLFYPPDNNSGAGTETGYGQSWLVCTGPDGLPGDILTNPGTNPAAYLRNYIDGASNVTPLGTGDDIVVRF